MDDKFDPASDENMSYFMEETKKKIKNAETEITNLSKKLEAATGKEAAKINNKIKIL